MFLFSVLEVGFKRDNPFISGSCKCTIICLQITTLHQKKKYMCFSSKTISTNSSSVNSAGTFLLHNPLYSFHETETFCLSKKKTHLVISRITYKITSISCLVHKQIRQSQRPHSNSKLKPHVIILKMTIVLHNWIKRKLSQQC